MERKEEERTSGTERRRENKWNGNKRKSGRERIEKKWNGKKKREEVEQRQQTDGVKCREGLGFADQSYSSARDVSDVGRIDILMLSSNSPMSRARLREIQRVQGRPPHTDTSPTEKVGRPP